MSQYNPLPSCKPLGRHVHRAAVAVYVAICGTVIIGFAALAIDIGMLYATQAEMQRCADAVAMAATWELLGEERLLGGASLDELELLARETAAYVGSRNPVQRDAPIVDEFEDVDVGYLSDLTYGSSLVFTDAAPANAMRVRVRRDSERGGSIALYFAGFLGANSKDLLVKAVAGFEDGIVGYEVTDETGNADLLPFALHVNYWDGLLAGTIFTGDDYSYDPETGAVNGKLPLIDCPKDEGTKVYRSECDECQSRDGCPAWPVEE